MVRNWFAQWLDRPLLAAAFLAGGVCTSCALAQERGPSPGAIPRAQAPQPAETLRLTFDAPGDSKPVVVDADEIAIWAEDGRRVVVLRGRVLIQQNVIQTRCQQAVAWIDEDNFKRTGIQHLELYCEGEVGVDNSADLKRADRAVLTFNTRGELKLNAHAKPIVQQAQANDPLVLRGRSERAPETPRHAPTSAPRPAAAPPLTPPAPVNPPVTSPAPFVPGVIQQTAFQESAPARTVQGPPPVPPDTPVLPTLPAPRVGDAVPGVAPLDAPSRPAVHAPLAIDSPTRQFSVLPRNSHGYSIDAPPPQPGDNGLQTIIVTGGVILTVRNAAGTDMLDIEADRLVIWTRGVTPQQLLNPNALGAEPDGQRHLEFYLAGNVELRQTVGKDSHILRADEIYYDTNRNVAIALKAQLEFKPPLVADPIVVKAEELYQHAPQQYEVVRAEIFSSKLPSDPGLKVFVRQATIEDKAVPKFGTFGQRVIDRTTGEQMQTRQTIFKGQDVYFELEHVPFFYLPYLSGDARDPLGPVEDINFGYNRIFGFQFGTSLNLYDLFGIQPFENTKWRGQIDYLTARGPALGTTFDYSPKEVFGVPAKVDGSFTAYGIYDDGFDVLGGGRTWPQNIPEFRGRVKWRQGIYELPNGFTVQTQLAYLSDRNFHEQYFFMEFLTDINQSTFVYVKQVPEHANYGYTGLIEPRLGREWVTQTESLPRVDGYLIGQSFFDVLSYSARGSLGYYSLDITNDTTVGGERVISSTDRADRTGRFDLLQELSLPFGAGPFRLVPYGKLDLTEYTQDLQNQEVGRVWGGGGVRGSIPFTRLFPDVQSELWNLNGINHKLVLGANYQYMKSNEPHTRFPQLDRLNDDETDQALRDLIPNLPLYYPGLARSPAAGVFDPQGYALRRLVESKIDTLDSIEVLQLDLRQRLQTKRGYPGSEHIVDWMTLDLSGSFFPNASRDDVNRRWAFLEYDYVWNLGDRTTLTSTGWVDPYPNSARVFTIGAYLNRTDRTNFFLGYRYIDGYKDVDPINSRALTAALTYIFSPKYAMSVSATYDFGSSLAESNSLVFTRMGSDLQISVGITYNALQSTVGGIIEIVPNLVPANRRVGPITAVGGSPNSLGVRN